MPTIRLLTPADLPLVEAMVDVHTSGAGAWCNDRTAPARAPFAQLTKDNINILIAEAMTFLFGYFTDDGHLVAWTLFNRWLDNDNVTIRQLMEDPTATLTHATGQTWSDEAVDLVNWAMGWFWTEGVSCFWSRVYTGRETMHISRHPNSQLSEYTAAKVIDVPAQTKPPDQYNRVSFSSLGDNTSIYQFTDPQPLAQYLKDQNATPGNAQ
jgi:hypothetical protein